MSGLALGLRILLGLVFAVAGVAKLADREGARTAIEGFGVPPRMAGPGAVLLPLAELSTTVCLLVPVTAWWGAVAALGLVLVFIAAIAVSLLRGRAPDCHCFGSIHSAPVGRSTLIRNGVLTMAAVGILVGGNGSSQLSPVGWIGGLTTDEKVFGAITATLVVVIGLLAWFLFQLLRQHGRVLIRLDQLEGAGGAGRDTAGPALGFEAATDRRQNGQVHQPGLPLGTPAPAFQLPGLDGEPVSLERLREAMKPVLLIFTDPGCGPCQTLMPLVGEWQRDLGPRLTIAVISRGDIEDNIATSTEHGVANVLLQEDREVAGAYLAYGTPSAALVSVDGRVRSALAGGVPAITALVGELSSASGAPGSIEVLQAAPSSSNGAGGAAILGTHVPSYRAGDEVRGISWTLLDRGQARIEDFRGKPLLLVFWNPDCGFCKSLLPQLREWEDTQESADPQLLLVSTADAAKNRELGLTSPIVLEDGMATGARFGARGTPTGVLMDASGRVATSAAVGGQAIMELLDATRAESLLAEPAMER